MNSQKTPTTVENDSSNGTTGWANTTNLVSGSVGASVTLGAGGTSQWIKATSCGFALPLGAVIRGIAMAMEVTATGLSLIRETAVALVKAGTVQTGGAKTFGLLSWLTSFGAKSAGDATDLWGTTWSPSDINHTGFGVAFRIQNIGVLSATANARNLSVTVYYDLPRVHSMAGTLV